MHKGFQKAWHLCNSWKIIVWWVLRNSLDPKACSSFGGFVLLVVSAPKAEQERTPRKMWGPAF